MNSSENDETDVGRKPVVEYIRMSTEHQQYSTANQQDVIREYARRRGLDVVNTYADEGKSGLRIAGREALTRLIEDVQSGSASFGAILVYDISRWGRFQDADESAYYEYLCKRAGIDVHYCAEQFENDGGPASTIIKSVKRAMAGEYSRELSTKVFQGQCRLIELGYRQGGPPGYGLRRMLIDQHGNQKAILDRGDQKSLQTDRVILVPGPEDEQAVVRRIYHMFTGEQRLESQIAEILNSEGLLTDFGRQWTRATVRQVLTNEKYIGNNVYNRRSFKLKQKRVENPPEMWVRADGTFAPIVSPEAFYMARGIIQERNRRYSSEEMIAKLRELARTHGTLSAALIDTSEDMPASASYRNRFGSLLTAYRQAGCAPERDYGYIEAHRSIRQKHPLFLADLTSQLELIGASITQDASSGLLIVNGEYTASLILSRYRETAGGAPRWLVRISEPIVPDITILARMDPANEKPADYYLLPIIDIGSYRFLLCEANGAVLDTYQFDSLDFFVRMAARRKLGVAA
jgi:DNA invertase Pin-like site-specific DNA recombinase